MARYSTPRDPFATPSFDTALPTDRPVALYYRQSTMEQVGNVSTAIQTIDMADYLVRLGWPRDAVILIDMDEGISGTKKIDERPGMKFMYSLIARGEVGAIACQDEDRLFRDITQIQVNIFIEACRTANVRVITPTICYDFAHPLMGDHYARQFRFKCEMAAEYLKSFVIGKLARARHRLHMEGRWSSGRAPVGMMVDMRKYLPDGTSNPQWRRYAPFEPYAEVVNEYFRLCLELNCNLRGLAQHIAERGPHYPDPSVRPPDGFIAPYQKMREGARYPTRQGLYKILTNAVYIGHWPVRNAIVRWNNHPAIVPVDVFECVFNALSGVALDGSPNPYHTPLREHRRPSREDARPDPPPLCLGFMAYVTEDKLITVGHDYTEDTYWYTARDRDVRRGDIKLWSRKAEFIDKAVGDYVREKLRVTFRDDAWARMLAGFRDAHAEECARLKSQLKALEQVQANLIASLERLDNHDMIPAVQARYEEHERERMRLMQLLDEEGQEARARTALLELRERLSMPVIEGWHTLEREEQRRILYLLVKRIDATPSARGVTELDIFWRDDSVDRVIVTVSNARGRFWRPEEAAQLEELVRQGASKAEIRAAFPDRSRDSLRHMVDRARRKIRQATDTTSESVAPTTGNSATRSRI